MTSTPIRDAFTTLRRAPSLWFAEIAWRWAFGAAALVLAFLALFTWLDSLPVSRVDQVLLASGSAPLVGRAMQHIFRGSAARLLRALAVLLPGMVVLWTVAAATGRAAILRTLMPESRAHWRSLLLVSFLRAMTAVAASVAILAAVIAFARVATPRPTAAGRPGAAWLIFLFLVFGISVCWSLVNRFLAVSAIYAATSRRLSDALNATATNFRDHPRQWFWIGTAFGLIHLALFLAFSAIGPMPLTIATVVPRWFTLLVLTVLTLIYFALVDAIHVLRLVSYLAIAEPLPTSELEPATVTSTHV
jgi:hypothetical protein